MKALIIALSFLFTAAAQAALVTPSSDTVTINDLNLPKTVTTQVAGQADPVTLTGVMGALRAESPFGNIYNIEFFVDQPAAFVKSENGTDTLDNLIATQNIVAMRLNIVLLFGVSSGQLQNAFAKALVANSVDLTDPAIKSFVKAVNAAGGAGNGQTVTFLLVKGADGGYSISYEAASGKKLDPVVGGEVFGRDILSIWLGKISAADPGLLQCKTDLLK